MGQPCAITGGQLMCSFGLSPSALVVLPVNRVMIEGRPAANVMDQKPLLNIPPFGMCVSLANPMVASATAAALGVLVPMPCLPVTVAPWAPGAPQTLVAGAPALTQGSMCSCAYGGVIQIVMPGATTTTAG